MLRLILIVLQMIAALALIALIVKEQGLPIPLFSGSRYIVTADFANADGLDASKKPPVMVAGVTLGTVSDVSYEHGMAVATLDLSGSARGRIFNDASVLITPRSAINDLTVDIVPGTPSAGAPHGRLTIPEARTQSAINLDRLTDVLDADTRSQLIVLIDELGIGLHGRSGSLDQAVAELEPFLTDTDRLTAKVDQRQHLLSELVTHLQTVFATLGKRGAQLQQVIDDGRTTLGAVAAHQTAVEDTMTALAPAFGNIRTALTGLQALSTPLVPALRRLGPVARRLPAALRSLRSFVPSGLGLVKDLLNLDHGGTSGSHALSVLAQRLGPAASALHPSTAKLAPVLRSLSEYPNGIGDLGSHYSGIFSGQNANGPTLRAYGFFEPINPADFGISTSSSAARPSLLDGLVGKALRHVCTTQNPLACLALELTPGVSTSAAATGSGS
jgi:phospholipid/cholesterol/gamma-HCH transport system substrate-binding protein